MFITRMALPRRTFLRGLGATVALPLLDAMMPALSVTPKAASQTNCRMGFVYVPNGVARNDSINAPTATLKRPTSGTPNAADRAAPER